VELKKAFTACKMNSNSETTLKELLESISEKGMKYPPLVLNFFLNILNVKDMFDDKAAPSEFSSKKNFNG
jgi:hypothetical protein